MIYQTNHRGETKDKRISGSSILMYHCRKILYKLTFGRIPVHPNPTKAQIKEELARIKKQLHKHTEAGTIDSEEFEKLYVAQQALSWVTEKVTSMSPYDMVMGIPSAPED